MNNAPSQHNGRGDSRERLLDLLCAQATEGLDAASASELQRLLAEHPDVDAQEFEIAAAAATLAIIDSEGVPAAMPREARDRLVRMVPTAVVGPGPGVSPAPELMLSGSGARRLESAGAPVRRISLGWLAAAAAIVLAAIGWYRAVAPPAPAPTLREQFAQFTRTAPDVVRCAWAGKEPGFENVSGEVVWSDQRQAGYMVLKGLPANDPTKKQYQLWVVDPQRDKNPVDGGVFDIAATPSPERQTVSGEVIVPIDCKLRVSDPKVFALTVEQPGGVVVSAGPLVVVAAR